MTESGTSFSLRVSHDDMIARGIVQSCCIWLVILIAGLALAGFWFNDPALDSPFNVLFHRVSNPLGMAPTTAIALLLLCVALLLNIVKGTKQ